MSNAGLPNANRVQAWISTAIIEKSFSLLWHARSASKRYKSASPKIPSGEFTEYVLRNGTIPHSTEVTDMKRFLSMLVALVFALTCVGTIIAAEQKAKAPAGDNTVTDNTVKKAPAPSPAPKKK